MHTQSHTHIILRFLKGERMDELVLKLPKEANAKRVKVKAKKMNSVIWERGKRPDMYSRVQLFSCGGQVFIKYYFLVGAKSS